VRGVRGEWNGCTEIDVDVEAREGEGAFTCKGLAYDGLVGRPEPGDRVLLNCNAIAKGLGTGGYALVVAIPDRLPADVDEPGHIVKARYTPMQAMRLAVDEDDSPHRAAVEDCTSLDGMPVVVADLHSALAPILAGITATAPGVKVAYVMTDGGSLPAWFSRALDRLADRLCTVVTAGQCFGGDLEATNVHNALLAARAVADADIAVVAQGPGNLGTGTVWGFSGTAAGEAVNAAAVLGGRPVASLRISEGDARERHRGISHHSMTAYGRVALAPADVPVPKELPEALRAKIEAQLDALRERHRLYTIDTEPLIDELRALPVRLSTMGRGLDEDRVYFTAAGGGGRGRAAPRAAAGAPAAPRAPPRARAPPPAPPPPTHPPTFPPPPPPPPRTARGDNAAAISRSARVHRPKSTVGATSSDDEEDDDPDGDDQYQGEREDPGRHGVLAAPVPGDLLADLAGAPVVGLDRIERAQTRRPLGLPVLVVLVVGHDSLTWTR
jgi:hypothetical protein